MMPDEMMFGIRKFSGDKAMIRYFEKSGQGCGRQDAWFWTLRRKFRYLFGCGNCLWSLKYDVANVRMQSALRKSIDPEPCVL